MLAIPLLALTRSSETSRGATGRGCEETAVLPALGETPAKGARPLLPVSRPRVVGVLLFGPPAVRLTPFRAVLFEDLRGWPQGMLLSLGLEDAKAKYLALAFFGQVGRHGTRDPPKPEMLSSRDCFIRTANPSSSTSRTESTSCNLQLVVQQGARIVGQHMGFLSLRKTLQ